MSISNLKLKGKVFLAPMAGVNDLAFRSLCHKYGSAMNFTEMVNVNAIERKNKATMRLAYTLDEEKPVAIQLFGSRISAIKKSIKILEDESKINPDMFDFNFGCPVQRIMSQGAGSALLKRPSKVGEIINAMRSSTDLPISGKIRLGISPKVADYVNIAKIIEKNGADMLIVHGRYQNQGYSGNAHWDKIKEIKECVNIPIVGNGDVVDENSAKSIFQKTNCDYIMVGRGCMGNPFIFQRINNFLNTGKNITQKDKFKLFLEYIVLAKKYNVKSSLVKMQAMYFTKGVQGSAKLRNKISCFSEIDDIYEIFKSYNSNLDN
jgi:tRNA-dihydrouridine synthase B